MDILETINVAKVIIADKKVDLSVRKEMHRAAKLIIAAKPEARPVLTVKLKKLLDVYNSSEDELAELELPDVDSIGTKLAAYKLKKGSVLMAMSMLAIIIFTIIYSSLGTTVTTELVTERYNIRDVKQDIDAQSMENSQALNTGRNFTYRDKCNPNQGSYYWESEKKCVDSYRETVKALHAEQEFKAEIEREKRVAIAKASDLAVAFMSINDLSRDSAKLQDSVLSVLARPSITGGLILATPTPNRAVYNMELTEKLLRTLK